MALRVITDKLDGLTAPVPGADDIYDEWKRQVDGSSVAKDIYAFLDPPSPLDPSSSKLTVGVLLIDHGFDSMYIPPFQLYPDGGGVYSGGVAVLNVTNPLTIENVELPLGVSLIHELGHAVQYAEDPVGFQDKFNQAQSGSKARTRFDITDSEGRALTRSYSNADIAKLEIENDNVARHEAPVCDELGLPYRRKYR
jgi:hypothetical protein